jgi:radical SAM protein with 4Fe4S-binding SPASM domain
VSVSFRGLLNRAWDANHLYSAMIELTYRCNLDCFLCYNDTSLKGLPLTCKEYLDLLADLAGMGVMDLTFSGGEPLVHPDFFTLGARARQLGFVVRIKSNGHALGRSLSRRLKAEVDPFQLDISLHGATAAVHDRQTRVPGSFERLVDNLGAAKDAGLRFQLRVPLTAWNEHQVDRMFVLADRLQVKIVFDTQLSPRDNGDASPLSLSPSAAGIEHLRRLIRSRGEALEGRSDSDGPYPQENGDTAAGLQPSRKHCAAGSSHLTIDPMGNVYPCVQWRRRLGSLHRQRIGEIWAHSSELPEIRALSERAKDFIDAFGEQAKCVAFCPGLAEQLTGNPLKLYPSACLNLEVFCKIAAEKNRGG